jgi:hypothetical protein
MKQYWKWVAVASLVVGFWAGYSSRKPVTIIETKVVTVEREVERTTEKGITVVERPDGTVETRIEEREVARENDKKTSIDARSVSEPRPDWGVGLYASLAPRSEIPNVTLYLERRVIGDLSLGVYGRFSPMDQNLEAGVGLSYRF